MMEIEVTGADVESAIETGLARLGVGRDEVEIEVLDEGSRGVFGLGVREARVRLTRKPKAISDAGSVALAELTTPAEPAESVAESAAEEIGQDEAEVAQRVLLELLAFLGMGKARVDVHWVEPTTEEDERLLMLDVRGPNIQALIGRRGKTLAALQHITRLIIGRELAGRIRLVVDVDGFKARRERSLRRLAKRAAEQAVRTDRTVVLEPMPPNERRIIHLALRDHPHVTTQSIGEGDRRKVTIIPRH